MSINYNDMSSNDKVIMLELFNAKQTLENAKELYDKARLKAFNIVKDNGSVVYNTSKATFKSGREPRYNFNVVEFSKDHSRLYNQYKTKRDNGVKDSISVEL